MKKSLILLSVKEKDLHVFTKKVNSVISEQQNLRRDLEITYMMDLSGNYVAFINCTKTTLGT